MIKKALKKILPSSVIRMYNQFVLKRNSRDFIAQPIAQVFTDIYRKNYWSGNQSLSGRGSDLTQVREIQRQIPVLLKKYNIRSLLDIPCGDFFWMKEIPLSSLTYTGADIVEEMIAENQQKYGASNRIFTVLDLTKDDLPEVDLIFCRDCLVHLSFENITKAIGNIKKSKATYLLTTSFIINKQNIDIPTGNWRPLNLLAPPYQWPAPLEVINEKCTEDNGDWADKSLLLWRIGDLNLPISG